MDTIKYIAKRLVMALFILFGVSIIIYALARMMPTDFVDNQYSSAIAQGTMTQEDVDRIKDLYGLSMPDAFLTVEIDDESNEFSGKKFVKDTKEETHYDYQLGLLKLEDFYKGSYDCNKYRLVLENGGTYKIYLVESAGASVEGEADGEDNEDVVVTLEETLILKQEGTYTINEEGRLTFNVKNGSVSAASCSYRVANFWDTTGAILSGYFSWLGNMFKGDFGMSFKYKKPVLTVIWQNMDVSFMIAFVATILQFIIAIPLGIKAARNQYGVVDYTVTILSMTQKCRNQGTVHPTRKRNG